MTTALRASRLEKTHRRGGEQVHALRGVGIEVEAGQLVALIGRSGSGKTTLLNCLLGWERPDRGEVEVPGVRDPAAAPWTTVAVVPQRFGLLDELGLADNVALAARLAALPRPREAAVEALGALRLALLADRLPGEVSLGEQQRTALARALVVRPAFLVADEPTGQLDAETGLAVMGLLRGIVEAEGVTAVVATHDPVMIALADRVLRIRDGSVGEHPR